MNAPISRSSAALLALGAVMVLLLGAFTHLDRPAAPPAVPANIVQEAAVEPVGEPELPPNLSPGLAEIFKLARAHVDENVILAYIHNSGQTYSPSADEILYLSDLGLSQTVIAALFKQKPAAPETPAATSPAESTAIASATNAPLPSDGANAEGFHAALAPYGTWTQIPDYGLAWQPTAATLDADWRPYVDRGQWLDTQNGWYWQSDYSWGWAAFHYGNWTKDRRLGWVWVPGKVWGPAWVSWRIASSYSGWAPLPPGVGLNTHGFAGGLKLSIPPGWYTFVSEDNFLSRNLSSIAIPPSQAAGIFPRSLVVNTYSLPNHKALNMGFSPPGANWEAPTAAIKPAPAQSIPFAYVPETRQMRGTSPSSSLITREEASPPRQISSLPTMQVILPQTHKPLTEHSTVFAQEHPIARETPPHFPGGEPMAYAPQLEPPRIMAAPVTSTSKSGK